MAEHPKTVEHSKTVDAKDAEIASLKAQLAEAVSKQHVAGSVSNSKPHAADSVPRRHREKLDAESMRIGEVIGMAIASLIGTDGRRSALLQEEPLEDEYKGDKTYVVGPTGHFRDNRMYQAGELVTVTDQRPAKDWVVATAADHPVPSTDREGYSVDRERDFVNRKSPADRAAERTHPDAPMSTAERLAAEKSTTEKLAAEKLAAERQVASGRKSDTNVGG